MLKKIRVLHLINGLGRGGAEMVLARLLEGADRSRFSQSVISLTAQAEMLPVIEQACEYVELLGVTKASAVAKIPHLIRTVRKLQPDLVQCWMYQSNLLGGVLRPWLRPRGLVWGLHHSKLDRSVDKLMTRAVARASALVSRRADRIVSCSQSGLDFHKSIGYAGDRLVFIPNGFDPEAFKPSPVSRAAVREEMGVGDEDLVIGTVARYHPTKGYCTLMQAASRFLQMNRSVHFVMVGRSVSRDNTELTKYLQESIGSKRVHLLGERSDIERVMPALDIYTSASHSEAFSITIGEAMACGIPCVVTDVGDSAMIVGETGYVIEPRNPEALIEAWQHMVRIEQAGRTALGEKARMRIIDHFSLKRVVQMYASMYDEILQNQ